MCIKYKCIKVKYKIFLNSKPNYLNIIYDRYSQYKK